jgi:hypothetical protein
MKSKFKGVCQHRRTGRWEAHLWLHNHRPSGGLRRGFQLYVGWHSDAVMAAHAHDLASMKMIPGRGGFAPSDPQWGLALAALER